MKFTLPKYTPPDFSRPELANAPLVRTETVAIPGVAPENYHATAIYPEYFQVAPGDWRILHSPRMDCVAVQREDGYFEAVEFRRLQVGDRVAVGRGEDGEDGIYVHTGGFPQLTGNSEKFAFRTGITRETSFSIDYDQLYELLHHDKDHGFILWVLGPAVVFDSDAREAFADIIRRGYAHGMLAGNALATHDLEGALKGTALGQEIYTKVPARLGHYNHLDALNTIRGLGSIKKAVEDGHVKNGVMREIVQNDVPYVLAGSIRDDGPLPEVVADVYEAQNAMRALAKKATTVITLATQLHTIATGNMTPSYHVNGDGSIRPVYFFSVDMSEFAAGKLADRGSLTAKAILTNVQDFVVTLNRGLARSCK